MKIIYKSIPMEFYHCIINDDFISFLFRHKGVKVGLVKTNYSGWYFGLDGRVPEEQRKTNELYRWNKQIEDPYEEGKELYDFLFKKSPLRIKLLMELGPMFYENNK